MKTGAQPNVAKPNFHQKKVSLNRFVGATLRSNKGCWGCRKRRKKCDETHPACNACVKRNIRCVWRTEANEPDGDHKIYGKVEKNGPTGVEIDSTNQFGLDSLQVTDLTPDLMALVEIYNDQPCAVDLSSALEMSPNSRSPDPLTASTPTSLGFETFCNIPPFHVPDFSIFLDSKGVSYVKHFNDNVSGTLTVSPSASNYFSKTFLMFAGLDEGIGHAIASWGAYYVHSHLHDDVEHHFGQAVYLMAKRFGRGTAVTKYDYFILIIFHLVLLGFFICQGDTHQWWICFEKCHELIERCGGLEKLCEDFNYSNDIKFLVSNFFFHDINASHAFVHGPLIESHQYHRVFRNGFFDSEYGVDPLQGCLNPVYLLLVEELEIRTVMRSRKMRLDSLLNGELVAEDDPGILHEFDVMRRQYLEFCADMKSQLEPKIANCQIDPATLARTEKFEREIHIETFAVFKLACQLYWVLYIKEVSPTSNELQLLLIELMDRIKTVVDSRMVVMLCLPLVMAGVACSTKLDRRRLKKAFLLIMEKSPIKNVRKAWVVVQEVWKKNPDGDKTLDWADVCEELGWELNIC